MVAVVVDETGVSPSRRDFQDINSLWWIFGESVPLVIGLRVGGYVVCTVRAVSCKKACQ